MMWRAGARGTVSVFDNNLFHFRRKPILRSIGSKIAVGIDNDVGATIVSGLLLVLRIICGRNILCCGRVNQLD